MNTSLDIMTRLTQGLAHLQPKILAQPQHYAAVLVPIVKTPEPSILFTLRSSHLSSHPGQVSFPGGMSEAEDDSIVVTALRESSEEIALHESQCNVLSELSTLYSKDGVMVYPIVAVLDSADQCIGNPDEIAEIFTVPWPFFQHNKPEFQLASRQGTHLYIPHFYYQQYHIWGLTAMILLELLNAVEGTRYPLPEFATLANVKRH